MDRYIIQKKAGIVEFYAGPQLHTSKRCTSNIQLATSYTNPNIALQMAIELQRTNNDGVYTVRKIVNK